ncbi:MSHA biogenesis protein MshK [Wenzhouxiangella sediminis]|uniref:MSHA biogenesis protein MshK n=1 Tax=Wenzhouxiangella sediminis TaxID=1792836 RepID=A0A3E1KCJ8_9GAMM|nr:MSHA biogenesis protein MshK [Wenzhouxiangella sediminis]RFF32695.1 MSHA biogenesis protein MshK [Wenzhouxiangella sediminis]
MRMIPLMFTLALASTAFAQGETRDPTRPPTDAEIAAWFGNGSGEEQRAPFRLQSILLAPERRIAIIDGQRLREGERLGDAEIRVIEPGRVVLVRAGETIELNIDTHLTNDNDGF